MFGCGQAVGGATLGRGLHVGDSLTGGLGGIDAGGHAQSSWSCMRGEPRGTGAVVVASASASGARQPALAQRSGPSFMASTGRPGAASVAFSRGKLLATADDQGLFASVFSVSSSSGTLTGAAALRFSTGHDPTRNRLRSAHVAGSSQPPTPLAEVLRSR